MPGFVLLVREREDGDPAMRLGFTVTKKIGGAVVRNRMKRRFRALARDILPGAGIPGADHVLIGRSGGVERDYASLAEELRKVLLKITKTIRPELVEGRSFLPSAEEAKGRPSTGPGRTGGGDAAQAKREVVR